MSIYHLRPPNDRVCCYSLGSTYPEEHQRIRKTSTKRGEICHEQHQQTSSVTSMMSQLGWEELRLRRARIKTILLFKIVNNLVDIPPEPFLIPTGAITRGHNIRFLQPHTRTITMQYSFFPSAIRTWNTLPQQLASMTSPWRVSDRPWPTPPLYHRTTPSVFNCIYWTF